MQKQKTLAKWLAIILLCSVAVGSYVLYDALYIKKQDNQANADNQNGNTTDNVQVEDDHTPYYTILPRATENIDGVGVSHFGGEDDDYLLDVINFGKKRFAIFSSNSVEFDMRQKGLSVAIIDDSIEGVYHIDENCTYIDGKMSSNGVALLTKNTNGGSLYFVNANGAITAQIPFGKFDDGALYLSGQNLLLFIISNGYLHSYTINDDLTISKSPFISRTTHSNIVDVFDTAGGQGIVTDNFNNTEICLFSQNTGFNIVFRQDKLLFKQIITAGTLDDNNYIIYGMLDGTPWLYGFDTDFNMTSSKAVENVLDGVILPYQDGFLFVGNGMTKSYCKHLDTVMSTTNNLSFQNIKFYTYGTGNILAVAEDNLDKVLIYVDRDFVKAKTLDFGGEIVAVSLSKNNFSLCLNSTSTTGFFRANFGKTDPFILDFGLSYFAEN